MWKSHILIHKMFFCIERKTQEKKTTQVFMNLMDYLNGKRQEWLRTILQLTEPEHKWLRLLT